MSRKYYTHFVTDEMLATSDGYRGVVELRAELRPQHEVSDLRTLLARNFDVSPDEIRILNWATLH